MDKKGKKVVTSLAVLAGLASGAGALNAFANKTVKAMLYRHRQFMSRKTKTLKRIQ